MSEVHMGVTRRDMFGVAAAGAVSGLLVPAASLCAARGMAIKAVAFDAFAIFDPRPIAVLAERLVPGRGRELVETWRTRQFEYQWLRALSGRYADFLKSTEDALAFAADLLGLQMAADTRRELLDSYLTLPAWPDVAGALERLKRDGVRSALLSNATSAILHAGIANTGLDGLFERVLSTDAQHTYKPDPRAYRMAVDGFRLGVDEILFVASAGWDAAGAKAFGYRTFWVNRMGLPPERLDVGADGVGRDLGELISYLAAIQSA